MSETRDRATVLRKLCELAAEQASVSATTVNEGTDLYRDLNFDSLDAVEYTMMIEEAFDVTLPDERAQTVRTVGDAVNVLQEITR